MRKVAFAVCTEFCNGCQTCQVACREINRVPFKERWLEVHRNAPKLVDDRLRLRCLHAPELDKCVNCLDQDEQPYCQQVCPSKCLLVGGYEEVMERISSSEDAWSVSVESF